MGEILQGFALPIIMIGLAISAFATFIIFARNYRRCPPNKVLVVFGRKRKEQVEKDGRSILQTRGYRLITGGAAFVYPLFEEYKEISLETVSIDSNVSDTPNVSGVLVEVDATANVKVSSKPELLSLAVERMLGKTPQEIHVMLKTTLDGLLRQIVGTLTVEEIVTDREALAQKVLSGAQTELNKLGFEIDVFVVNKIGDKVGYIEAMGKKRTAEVKRDATIAEAEANRDATIKSSEAKQKAEAVRLGADRQIAESQRDLDLKKAEFKKSTETADAEAAMARDLKTAEVDKDLRQRRVEAEEAETKARIGLAEQEAARVQQELQARVIRPAEAEATAAQKRAEAIKTLAEAEKQKLSLEGEGRALAEAALTRELGNAQGEAIGARLGAEAEGLRKKNEALATMSDAAKLIIVLERLPQIIEEFGEAGERIVGAAFEHVGQGMSRIDSVHIVDLGNDSGSGVAKFAGSIPEVIFGTLVKAKALGINVEEILEKLGVPRDALTGLLSTLKTDRALPAGSGAETAMEERREEAPRA